MSENQKTQKTNESILKRIVKNIIYPAAVIYLILTFLCSLLTELSKVSGIPVLSLSGIATILFFSICVSASNRLFFIDKFSVFGRTALHFVCFIASVIAVMLFTGYIKSGGAFMVVILISAVYILIAAIALIIYGIRHKKTNEEKKYKSMFS